MTKEEFIRYKSGQELVKKIELIDAEIEKVKKCTHVKLVCRMDPKKREYDEVIDVAYIKQMGIHEDYPVADKASEFVAFYLDYLTKKKQIIEQEFKAL